MNYTSLVPRTATARKAPYAMKYLPQLLALILTATSAALAQSYTIIDLGGLAGKTAVAYGINAAGDAVGFSMSTTPQCCAQAFLWRKGVTTFAPNAPITYATGINDRGVLVGNYDISGGAGCYEAFLANSPLSPEPQPQTVKTFPGFDCGYANGINNLNAFVGQMSSKVTTHAYLDADGAMFDLNNSSLGALSAANGINAATKVVGFYVPYGQKPTPWSGSWAGTRAFLSVAAKPLEDLNPLTLIENYDLRMATAINRHDRITGYAGGPNNTIRAYLLDCPGQICPPPYHFHDLGTFPNGGVSYGTALNSEGVVVGAAYLDASGIGNYRAVLFAHGRVVNLNQRLSPADQSQWTLAVATGINDNGEIVGWGIRNGEERAFKLEPAAHLMALYIPNIQLLEVVGVGFTPNSSVDVEVHASDIGGTLIKSANAATNSQGSFVAIFAVAPGQEVAISGWDSATGVYSTSFNLVL